MVIGKSLLSELVGLEALWRWAQPCSNHTATKTIMPLLTYCKHLLLYLYL